MMTMMQQQETKKNKHPTMRAQHVLSFSDDNRSMVTLSIITVLAVM